LVLEVSMDAEALAERMLSDACELVMGGWCQGRSAQDEMGRAIEPSSAFARSWSAAGALERVWRRAALVGDEVSLEAFERANLALAAVVKDAPQRWNDAPERTRAQVLEALTAAPKFLQAARGRHPLVDDLLDDLDRYQEIPASLFEDPA
jgi:hypothetical protein